MTLELTTAHRLAISLRLGDATSEAHDDVVRALYALGGTDIEIAAVMKVHPDTVRRARRRLRLVKPGPTPQHGGKALALVLRCPCDVCEQRRHAKYARENRRRQDRTIPTAVSDHRPWTSGDDDYVRGTLDLPVVQVARALGRTANSVIQRRARLRGRLSPAVRALGEKASKMYDEGMRYQDIADQLGVSRSRVARAVASVRLSGPETREVPGRHHERWTEDEDAILRAGGRTVAEQAALLKRSVGTVKARRVHLGITRPSKPWTAEQDELVRSDLPVREVAERIGRSVHAVEARRVRLRPSGMRFWTTGEDAALLSGRALEEVAEEVGRTVRACKMRLSRLLAAGATMASGDQEAA